MRAKKIKRFVVGGIWILVLAAFYMGTANAASGNVTLNFSEKIEGEILYLKVATMYNGEWKADKEFEKCMVNLNGLEDGKQMAEAAEKLILHAYDNRIEFKEKKEVKNRVCLNELEEGLYLIAMKENNKVKMSPSLVALPCWEEEKMSYDVTVVPKVSEKENAPKTGWNSGEALYICLCGIGAAIIVGSFLNRHLDYWK